MKPRERARLWVQPGRLGRMMGYSLAEVLVAIVCVALILGPVLAQLVVAYRLQHRTGEAARREAWRSAQDQALAEGIDPGAAPVFNPAINGAVPALSAAGVVRAEPVVEAGLAGLRALRTASADVRVRVGGAGWELVAGPALPPASPDALPLAPMQLAPPTVVPADGSRVPIASFSPGGPGQASTYPVAAFSQEGYRVKIVLSTQASAIVGLGSVQAVATAAAYAAGVRGVAWTEYPGDALAGQAADTLSDGRVRWTVTGPDGRTRVYEPSRQVPFVVGLDLGAPVLRLAGVDYASGSEAGLDYATYLDVRAGRQEAVIGWPGTVLAAFGPEAAALPAGFDARFNGTRVAGGSELKELFGAESAGLWQAQNPVEAAPLPQGNCTGAAASWTILRISRPLLPPEFQQGPALDGGAYVSGAFAFAVPAQPDGVRVGRVAARGDTLVSAGPNLELELIP